MNRFLLIHPTSNYDTYDYSSKVAGLDFDFGSIVSEMLTPNSNNWDKVRRALHAYAHFYQFTCTTYGFLNSFFSFCQATLVQSFLVELRSERGRFKRPLIESNLPTFDESKLTTGILHMLKGFENLRLGLYGASEVEQLQQRPFKETIEGVAIKTFLKTQFGIRDFIFARSINDAPSSYTIKDVLESHAYSLSTAWIIGLMIRQGIDKSVIDRVVEYSMDSAPSIYIEFIQSAGSGDIWQDYRVYSALCDRALYPSLFNLEK